MCTFCGGVATMVPTENCRVCSSCAKRIAELATTGDPRNIWQPAKDADEEATEVAERVASQVGREDSDSHYTLAIAFREMALYADALRAAGRALASAPNEAKALAALRLLLTDPLVRVGGLCALRDHLARTAMN